MSMLWWWCLWWPHAMPGLIMLRLVGEESSNVSSRSSAAGREWVWAGPAGTAHLVTRHYWHYGGQTWTRSSVSDPTLGRTHGWHYCGQPDMGDVTEDIIVRCQLDQWPVIISQRQLSSIISWQWLHITLLWLFIDVSHQWTWGHGDTQYTPSSFNVLLLWRWQDLSINIIIWCDQSVTWHQYELTTPVFTRFFMTKEF